MVNNSLLLQGKMRTVQAELRMGLLSEPDDRI
jgi:hypothetical protein